MSRDREWALDRADKLSALARAAAGAEAEVAQARLDAHMEHFGLTVTDLRKVDGPGADAPIVQDYIPSNGALWRASLAWEVARYAGVSMIRWSGRRGCGSYWRVIGRPQDFDLWKALFERAEAEIEAEGTRYAAQAVQERSWRSPRSEADTWRKGAARATAPMDKAASTPAPSAPEPGPTPASTALVLLSRDRAVKAKEHELYPQLKHIRIASGGSSSAYGSGHRHGSRMGVHRANLEG
jgi:hypothetical protein